MHTKKNAAFVLNVVLSMLILAYITFITVYEQILTQNNGFFNVIVYGVVLILVFIFITLFIRVISIKHQTEESSPVLKVLIIIGIIALFAVFTVMRLRYSSTISPTESPLYKTAVYITEGQIEQATDIHNRVIGYPADFIYAFILSDVFAITGADTGVYIIINIFMMLILAAFLFFTVNLIAGKACATMAMIILLFMPNNAYLVYSYNSELFIAAMFMIALFLYEVLIYKRFAKPSNARVIALICGVFGGIALSCEPVILLAYIVLTIWVFEARRQNILCTILPIIISLVEAFIFTILKAMMMGITIGKSLKGYFLCFVPTHIREEGGESFSISGMFSAITSRLNNPSRFLDDNSYFLTRIDGGIIGPDQSLWLSIVDQFMFLFVLILCVLCVVYILRVTYDKVLPMFSVMVCLFIGQVLGGSNQVPYIYFIITIIIIGSTTTYYMYLNHHPAYAVDITNEEIRKDNGLIPDEALAEKEEISEEDLSEYMLRARAIVFVGENENLYKQIKAEEKANRENNDIAATMMKTQINEDGVYDTVEEHLSYFDEPDEAVEAKPVHEVKAIPATRPVEVVKPILADDYAIENNEVYSNESDLNTQINVDDSINNLSEEDYFDEPDEAIADNTTETVQNNTEVTPPPVQPEGFVFRKKEDKTNSETTPVAKREKNTRPIKEEKKAAKEAEKQAKLEAKEAKKAAKKGMAIANTKKKGSSSGDGDDGDSGTRRSLKDVKPGEPLPNPLKGPAPSSKGPVGFDFDGGDGDDFDF